MADFLVSNDTPFIKGYASPSTRNSPNIALELELNKFRLESNIALIFLYQSTE